jgi:hypothetical protein
MNLLKYFSITIITALINRMKAPIAIGEDNFGFTGLVNLVNLSANCTLFKVSMEFCRAIFFFVQFQYFVISRIRIKNNNLVFTRLSYRSKCEFNFKLT